MAPFLYTHTHTHKVMFWFLPMKTFGRSCKCLFHDPFSACHQRICGHVSQRFFSTPPTARVCGHFSRFKLAGEWLRTFVTSRDHVFFFCVMLLLVIQLFSCSAEWFHCFSHLFQRATKKTWCYTFVFSCASCLRGYAHFWSFVTPASVPKGYGTDIDPFFVCEFLKSLNKTRILANGVIYGRLRLLLHVFTLYFSCVASVVMIRSSLLSEERTATVRTKTNRLDAEFLFLMKRYCSAIFFYPLVNKKHWHSSNSWISNLHFFKFGGR